MIDFDLNSFEYTITCENGLSDAKVDFEKSTDALTVFITATNDKPKFVNVKWHCASDKNIFVLGDTWERSYGDLEFVPLEENSRNMPWYFIATNKQESFCFGVKTQPNSFVNFTYDKNGICAKIDCRNGSKGVALGSRRLKLCTFVAKRYSLPPYESLCDFCKQMCDSPILPKEKIYGGNNWYFAYGNSSYNEIAANAALQAKLSSGIENKPFMVVDDGWQINQCKGPWTPNNRFRDMKKLADEIKSLGVRPGIWVRLLENTSSEVTNDMRIFRNGDRVYLDPTIPWVQGFIKNDIERIKSWGYELLKHDFSTVDLFGDYGKDLDDTITNCDNWQFSDTAKTNAEIVLDFYKLIKEACGDMLIIGCNTVSHLCAGLVQINRIGDDTSGKEWDRTRKMGVNTLAFRLAQNNAFYIADADCVGIMGKNIAWDKNRQWLDLLSRSDTALFISCESLDDNEEADIAKAYIEYQKPHKIKPIDIFNELTPEKWEIDEETIQYDW